MKILMFLLLFLSSLSSNETIISKIEVSKDNTNYINVQNIQDNDSFFDMFYIKLTLNKKNIADNKYFFRYRFNYNTFKSINVDALKDDNELIIKIDKNTKDEIVLHIDSTDTKIGSFLDFELFTSEEFKEVLKKEKLYFGMAYGIVFCAFLYNFILFIYNKQKSFLYYSLLQISLLFMLILEVMTLDLFKPLFEYINVPVFIGQLTLIFAVLFNREFLELKKYSILLDRVLLFLVFILLIDAFAVLITSKTFINDYIPISLVLGILVLSSLFVYKQGYKLAIFYILGWSIIFIAVLAIELEIFQYSDIYVLYVALPLESLILSFSLAYKMKLLENEKIIHEQMLIHQNKLASMGQMLNNIAHQYRQPLTHLGYILMNINSAYEHGELKKDYLDKKMQQANNQLLFMSETIDNFMNFYKPKKQKEIFSISKAINDAIFIIKPILDERNIKLNVDLKDDFEILGYENEYSQVVLNLLVNAKDELLKDKILNAQIDVYIKQKALYIKDNALGVPKHIEEKIFEPYFTTKEKSSGIGLYMSMLIIQEHFDGKLLLENSKEGATFIIKV